ncbi:MAG: PKD domain-containing protein [Chitinophagales bacterium]
MNLIYTLKKNLLLALLIGISSAVALAQNCGFSVGNTSGCAPFLVAITDTTTPVLGVTSRTWTVTPPVGGGAPDVSTWNGSGPNNSSFFKIYNYPGCYRVQLTVVVNGVSCTKAVNCAFTVNGAPSISGTVSPSSGSICPGGTVTLNPNIQVNSFSGSTCTSINTMVVDWGGGSQQIQTFNNPLPTSITHTYPNDLGACYPIRIFATDNCGCSAAKAIDTVCVLAAPVVDFSVRDNYNCAAPFRDTVCPISPVGSPGRYQYSWYIGNVFQQTTNNANCTTLNFPTGTHDITLTVRDTLTGCSTSLTKTDQVTVGTFPSPTFVVNPPTGCKPLTTLLTYTGNTTPAPVSYQWQVVGGVPSGLLNGTGVPQNLGVTYNNAGNFTAKLTVTYSGGCTAFTTAAVGVGTNIPVSFRTPDTSFCSLPDTVKLTYTGSACPTCQFLWDIPGAGSIATNGYNGPVSIPVTAFGTYGVHLTVVDQYGCVSDTLRDSVITSQPLRARVFKSRNGGCVGDTFLLVNRTPPAGCPIISKAWDFPGITPIYSTPDTFRGILPGTGCWKYSYTISTVCGCVDTLNDSLEVGRKINFTATDTPPVICFEKKKICIDINFIDTPTLSCRSAAYRPYDFWRIYTDIPLDSSIYLTVIDTTKVTDTLIDLRMQMCFDYKNFGTYIPNVVYYDNGCPSDTVALDSIVIHPPVANYVDSSKCAFPLRKYIYNKSKDANRVQWVVYNTCNAAMATDSIVSTAMDTFIDFSSCGCYAIKIIAYNDTFGCDHMKTGRLQVSCPITGFRQSKSRGCLPYLDSLIALPIDTARRGYIFEWDLNTADGLQFSAIDSFTPNYLFTRSTAGIYQTALKVTYPSGCTQTFIAPFNDTVTNVTPGFQISNNYSCIPLTVSVLSNTTTTQFTTVNTANSYYTNGITATHYPLSPNPTFTYNTLGPFLITQTIQSAEGCIYTSSLPVYPNTINADFILSDDTTCTNSPNPITCTSTGTGIVARYLWRATPGGIYTDSVSSTFDVKFSTTGLKTICLFAYDSFTQCSDTICKTIYIRNPRACFTLTDSIASCPPLFVDSFKNCSTGTGLTYRWDFGDGTNFSPELNPKHFYLDAGIFNPKLYIRDNDGCVDTSAPTRIAIDGPHATLAISNSRGCPCQGVRYQLSTVKATKALLILGCGLVINYDTIIPAGTETNPTVLDTTVLICQPSYCQAQIYLTGTGCSDTLSSAIQPVIIDSPIVSFKMTTRTCDKGRVCFTDYSVDTLSSQGVTIVKHFWNYGDASPIDSINAPSAGVCHFYNNPGWYVVTHGVRNSVGCYKEKKDSIYISRSPVIAMTVSDTAGCIPFTPNFGYTASFVDPRTSVNNFSWNFADPGSGAANTAAIANPTHSYNAIGTYAPILIVTDTFGCKDTATRRLVVYTGPTANAGTDKKLCVGDSITITGTGGTSCAWSPNVFIQDSSQCSTKVWPTTTTSYILTVTDIHRCTSRDTIKITSSDVTAAFVSDTVCKGFPNHFIASSTFVNDPITSQVWNFAGLGTASGATASFTFPDSGCYSVRLIATNGNGCKDTLFKSACVANLPIASFFFDTVCNGANTCFHNTSASSIGSINKNYWNFGDGTTDSVNSNPCHQYASAGNYLVRLTVCNSGNCCKDTTMNILVRQAPVAAFQPDSACLGDSTHFVDLSVAGSGAINNVLWQFSAPLNTTDTIMRPGNQAFIYPTSGPRQVTLTVSDVYGCSNAVSRNAMVFGNPTAQFLFSIACVNNLVQFTDQSTKGTAGLANWNWTFVSAPLTDNAPNPTHVFPVVNPVNPVTLIVTDSIGCKDTLTQNVNVYDIPAAVITTGDSILCLGESITLNNNSTPGTTAPIDSVNWDFQPDGIWDFVNQNTVNYAYPTSGTFRACAIVKDAFCADTACIKVRVNALPVASFYNDSNCIGIPTHLNSNSQPGDGAITHHLWIYGNPPTFIDSPSASSSYAFTVSGPVPVTLTVTDFNGCKDDTTKDVNIPPSAQVSIASPDTSVCPGYEVELAASGVYDRVQWSPTNWLDDATKDTVKARPLQTIIYVIQAYKGTCASSTDTVIVNVVPQTEIVLSATPQSVLLGLSSDITSRITTFAKIDSVVWSPDGTLSCRKCRNPVATPQTTTTYTVTTYYSQGTVQCSITDSITITVLQNCDSGFLYIPNTFTPNNDGENDQFYIRNGGGGDLKINYFRIYDRWGKLVYNREGGKTNHPGDGWNGKLNGDGDNENTGVFVYQFEVECVNGNVTTGKGNVTLLR